MAHGHGAAFVALVDDAKSRIREISIDDYRRRVEAGEPLILIDVREDHEWVRGRLPGAVHVGRGILERDAEQMFADKATPLVLQCGGGFRSALSADSLQKMGYTNVTSLAGGYREWVGQGLPVESD